MEAMKQPSINMVVKSDIFRLNTYADAKYGAFAWVQGQHSATADNNTISYQFTLYYVDRLKADKSNQTEVQSVGIDTLDNIIKNLDEKGLWVNSYTFQPFNQKFMDECAGVFARVTFNAPSGACAEDFADYNDDFNDDFLII